MIEKCIFVKGRFQWEVCFPFKEDGSFWQIVSIQCISGQIISYSCVFYRDTLDDRYSNRKFLKFMRTSIAQTRFEIGISNCSNAKFKSIWGNRTTEPRSRMIKIFLQKKSLFKLKFCYRVKLFFFSKNVTYDYKRVFVSNVYGLRLSFRLCTMSADDKAREQKQ